MPLLQLLGLLRVVLVPIGRDTIYRCRYWWLLTQSIAKQRMWLAAAGVSIDVLEGAAAASGKASSTHTVQRSPVCLIVKNLPYSTSEEDLVELFGASGQLARLVLPPTKTLALVEYTEPQDARRSANLLHLIPGLPSPALPCPASCCPAFN